MYRFIGYRPAAAELGKHTSEQLNPPDEPQYEGVVFGDGSVAMRWRTAMRSTSVWADFRTMYRVHGHPEYGTRIDWVDGIPDSAALAINELDDEIRQAKREAIATSSPGPL